MELERSCDRLNGVTRFSVKSLVFGSPILRSYSTCRARVSGRFRIWLRTNVYNGRSSRCKRSRDVGKAIGNRLLRFSLAGVSKGLARVRETSILRKLLVELDNSIMKKRRGKRRGCSGRVRLVKERGQRGAGNVQKFVISEQAM